MARPRKLTIATNLKLPLEIITETVAFMGKKKSGKTYGASKLCEEMLKVGAQVVVLDPVGNWFNLRISSDGKGEGFKIPVFGGDYGDVPLEANSGKLVASIIVEKGISAVLDVSDFSQGERKGFVKDFANELMRLKKRKRSPLHLFLEECRYFAPQKPQKGEEPMLGAVSSIVRKGRNYGIGVSLIDQRPASVNKEVLSQVEVLFALQLNHALDRKAIEAWVRTTDFAMKDIYKELPTLKPGQAWFWSPGWLNICKRIKISKKETFDGSSTPKFGEELAEQVVLSKLDLEQLRDSMTEMIERAKSENPKELKREIVRLKKELKKAGKGKGTIEVEKIVEVEKIEFKEIKMPVLDPVLVEKFGREVDRAVKLFQAGAAKLMETMADRGARLQEKADLIAAAAEDSRRMWKDAGAAMAVQKMQKIGAAMRRPNGKAKSNGTAPKRVVEARVIETPVSGQVIDPDALIVGKGVKKILVAIAMMGEGAEVSRPQAAMLAGVKHTTGSFSNSLSILRTSGLIVDGSNKSLVITREGREFLGDDIPDSPHTTEDLVAMWKPKLGGRCGEILDFLVDAHPDGYGREDIGEHLGVKHTTGSFSNNLSKLRTCGLMHDEKIDGEKIAFASDTLFPS